MKILFFPNKTRSRLSATANKVKSAAKAAATPTNPAFVSPYQYAKTSNCTKAKTHGGQPVSTPLPSTAKKISEPRNYTKKFAACSTNSRLRNLRRLYRKCAASSLIIKNACRALSIWFSRKPSMNRIFLSVTRWCVANWDRCRCLCRRKTRPPKHRKIQNRSL